MTQIIRTCLNQKFESLEEPYFHVHNITESTKRIEYFNPEKISCIPQSNRFPIGIKFQFREDPYFYIPITSQYPIVLEPSPLIDFAGSPEGIASFVVGMFVIGILLFIGGIYIIRRSKSQK